MNQENKLPIAYEMLDIAISYYNANVNDMSKFKLNEREVKMFVEVIEEHTRLHTKTLKKKVEELESTNASLQHQRDFYQKKLYELKGVHIDKDLGIPDDFEMAPITPSNTQVVLAEAYHRITAENQRLLEELSEKDDHIKHADIRINQLEYELGLLDKENEKLIRWKESAMKTFSDLNLQECANLLNIGLGQDIAVNIVPKIKDMKAETERLNQAVNNIERIYNDTSTQNARYREALEDLIPLARDGYKLHRSNGCHQEFLKEDSAALEKAKEALKGGEDE